MIEKEKETIRQKPGNSAFIKAGQARLLYMQAPISNSVVFIIGVIFYFILRSVDQMMFLVSWEILLVASGIFRLTLWYMRKMKPEARSPERWMQLYVFACAIMGLSWTLVYHLIYILNDPIYISAILSYQLLRSHPLCEYCCFSILYSPPGFDDTFCFDLYSRTDLLLGRPCLFDLSDNDFIVRP